MAGFAWFCVQLFFFLILHAALSRSQADACRIKLHFPSVESPLFPSASEPPRTNSLEAEEEPPFHYPEILEGEKQLLITSEQESLVMTCPGMKNQILNSEHVLAPVTCSNKGRTLFVDDKRVKERDVACERRPRGCLLHTKTRCYGDREGILHVIGWRITKGWFIPQITVCWDKEKETTIYTRHVIYGSSLEKRIASPGRPDFMPSNMYTGNIKSAFTRKDQMRNLAILLGDEKMVPGTPDYYFARGHMAADADFVLPAEQDATYFYANAIPQYQRFNNGNWKKMEGAIRQLAQQRKHSLVVFTGTMGTLSLKDVNGNQVPIYLDTSKDLYPVPLIIWKVVYDRAEKEAVAFLGLNMVKKDEELLSYLFSLCDDICHLLSWTTWTSKDWKRGALSCCRWEQFEEYVSKMDPFGKVRLLKD